MTIDSVEIIKQNSFNSFANELREMGVDEKTIEKEWEDYLESKGNENEQAKGNINKETNR